MITSCCGIHHHEIPVRIPIAGDESHPKWIYIYICICLDCIPIKSHLYHSFHLPSCSTVKPSAELAQAVRTLSPGSWARATGYWANCKRLRVKEACGSIGLKNIRMYIYIHRSNILDTVRYEYIICHIKTWGS